MNANEVRPDWNGYKALVITAFSCPGNMRPKCDQFRKYHLYPLCNESVRVHLTLLIKHAWAIGDTTNPNSIYTVYSYCKEYNKVYILYNTVYYSIA